MRGLKQWRVFAAGAGLALALGLAACGGGDDNGGGGNENVRPDDRRLDSAHRRPLRLRAARPEGIGSGGLRDQQGDPAGRRRPHGQGRPRGQRDQPAGRRPGGTQAGRLRQRELHHRCLGVVADTIPTAQSVSIPDGVLQISPASTSDEITGLDDDGLVNRTSPPDSFQGPTLANTMEDALGGAQGKTVNIGARNDAYGTGLAETFGDAWKDLGGTVGQQVIYDPEQPSYDSEAEQITSGNPDAMVIIDFPETFAKVGPALQRTGNWDPTKGWFTDGLASSDAAGVRRCAGHRRHARHRAGLARQGRGVDRVRHAVHERRTRRTSTVRRSTRRISTRRSSATWPRSPLVRPTARTWPTSSST